jgi:hypothetical protein
MVPATAEPSRSGPTKIAVAAIASPTAGRVARVAIRVAIDVAAS